MSLSFSQVVGGVLLYCGHPVESVLPRGFICEYGLDKITFYLTELNMTDENWLLMKRPLHVSANQSEYSLGAFESFGRPVLIETADESNPYHVRREIPIVNFQDRKLMYDGSGVEGLHAARSVSTYIRNGDKKIIIDPPGTGTYTIYYEPDRKVPRTLTDSAFPLQQFGGLLKAAIAQPCLAHCGYDDVKHGRLLKAIETDLGFYGGQFQEYIKQDSQPKTSIGRGFMTDDISAWEY